LICTAHLTRARSALPAIRFVLCDDKFYNMSHAERQHLIYQGPGPTDILQSYVEIVFDNSDNRIPIERDEVVLRRQIGLKKDEYFLDKKHVTKQDVISLLESAGLSRANPYYIVQQGRVNALSLMKDEQRLDLLKEVAGTNVYEQRRAESLQIMTDTEQKRVKVAEVLKYIEERLAELEAEKEELEKYRQLDRERRAIEYAYYETQYNQTSHRLDAVERERAGELEQANAVQDEAADASEQLAALEQRTATLRAAHTRVVAELTAAEDERREVRAAHAKLERELADAVAARRGGEGDSKETQAALKQLRQTIKTAERKLAAAKPAFDTHAATEKRLADELAESERRLNELYSKQGRAGRFKTKKERDAWIDGEVARLQATHAEYTKQAAHLDAEQAKATAALQTLDERVASRERGVSERRAGLEKGAKRITELRIRRDTLAAERKELWRDDASVSAEITEKRAECSAAERALETSVTRDVSLGIEAVRRIVIENRLQGVHGPLIELISTKPEFATAVQVAAKGALFHIVVDTDAIAAQVLEQFNNSGAKGRVSFIPLNRIDPPARVYPDTADVRPLVGEITTAPAYAKAVQHVFGKTLVCRSLEVAAMTAKQHKLNCITLDGDQVERKGALTGGFADPRQSWLASMERVKQCRAAIDALQAKHEKTQAQLQTLDAKISEVLGEIEKLETDDVTLRDGVEQLQADVRLLMRERVAAGVASEQRGAALATVRASLAPLQLNIDSLRAERAAAMHSQLSDAESAELHNLLEQQTRLQSELATATAARADAARQTTELEALLSENLKRREAELEAKAEREALALTDNAVAPLEHERQLAAASLESLDERCAALERDIAERVAEQRDVAASIVALQNGDGAVARRLLDQSKVMERLQQTRAAIMRQRDEFARKMRELGSLPDPALAAQLLKLTQPALLKRLRDVNENLREYSSVNKKAADQYVNFTDQRDSLLKRQQELDDGAESITDLIDSLDRKKDEAIERTFKAVAKHFREVFHELCPSGQASLIMQTRDPASIDSSQSQSQLRSQGAGGAAANRISRYTGVGIKVSFVEGSETVHLQQLSGGQKSLVALALVFALQRSDPAPFYLFDEIDSALDATHRSAVAQLIKEQSAKTQFLTTTFKPELAQEARKFFGISFTKTKVSTLKQLEKDTALSLLEEAARDDEEGR
jgi:structural maintenance of chromosome 3 (chondroitin sulfate proteoglycan 6)